ncbi:MAG: diguanylate cyclase [Desulfobulbaceae bacterium]|nr:diguanylate cyclase [Desulfobulbaceae bacterium]
MEKLIEQNGQQTCKVILQQLAHIDLDEMEAAHFWREVVAHHHGMGRNLGREVSLQTAICDYFCSVQRSMKNPTVVEMQTLEQTLRDSSHDFLTGLYNRKVFEITLTREIARARRHDRTVSLLFFDLDDFKKINDSFGHPAGDAVLREFASIVEAEKRIEDTAARFGGEEFVVILPDTGKQEALVLAERIRERLESSVIRQEGRTMQLTVSCGLATCPDEATDSDALIECADHALYQAKRNGKNTIVLYRSEKRRYLRIDFVHHLEVTAAAQAGKRARTAVSKDICLGGILFENQWPIDVGANVELTLALNNQETLIMEGMVVRLEIVGDKKYEIGVSFLDLRGNTEHPLSRHICQHLCPQSSNCAETKKLTRHHAHQATLSCPS